MACQGHVLQDAGKCLALQSRPLTFCSHASSLTQPFESFSLVDRDCNPDTCQGKCEEGLCVCSHDQFGMDCEFQLGSSVCQSLAVDPTLFPFPPIDLMLEGILTSFAVGQKFHILQHPTTGKYAKVYDMPVYYSNETYPADILFFGGRRWVSTIVHQILLCRLIDLFSVFMERS